MKLLSSSKLTAGVSIFCAIALLLNVLIPISIHADSYTDLAEESTFEFVSRPATTQDVTTMDVLSITRPGGGDIEEGDEILVIEMTLNEGGTLFQTFYSQNVVGSQGFVARGLTSFGDVVAPNLDDRSFTFRSAGGDEVEIEVAKVNVARDFFDIPRNAGPGGVNVPGAQIPTDDSTEEVLPTCEEKMPRAVSWAVCVVIDWVDTGVNSLVSTLNNLLSVNRSEVETADMRKAWSFFRNIASLLLVVIGLIMIIGQAISKE